MASARVTVPGEIGGVAEAVTANAMANTGALRFIVNWRRKVNHSVATEVKSSVQRPNSNVQRPTPNAHGTRRKSPRCSKIDRRVLGVGRWALGVECRLVRSAEVLNVNPPTFRLLPKPW